MHFMFDGLFMDMINISSSSGVLPGNLFCTYCTNAFLQATIITAKITSVEMMNERMCEHVKSAHAEPLGRTCMPFSTRESAGRVHSVEYIKMFG